LGRRRASRLIRPSRQYPPSRRQTKARAETLKFAEYVYVLTTLDAVDVAARDVLDLYRARWQIEPCFKRLKSLFAIGRSPKTNDASARAWIEGKLLTVLLIERLLNEARPSSPWGFEFSTVKPLA
jgi:IS4 transposase